MVVCLLMVPLHVALLSYWYLYELLSLVACSCIFDNLTENWSSGNYLLFLYFTGDTQAVVCEGDSLLLSCDKHQFLSILSANFGREENDVCTIDRKINDTCKSPSALNIMQNLCEDNKACTVTASASVFGDDCPNVTRYLCVFYVCKEGKSCLLKESLIRISYSIFVKMKMYFDK